MMRRVNVTGNAGSGKSTVSRLLAEALRLPLHGLDEIVWQPGWRQTPPDDVKRRIGELTREPSWVIDGVSRSVREAADTVVFLDVRRSVAMRRCARRNLPYLLRSRPGLPERCPEAMIVPTLFKIVMRFDTDVRPRILEDGRDPVRRFVHIQCDEELERLLADVGAPSIRPDDETQRLARMRRQLASALQFN